MTLNEKVCSKCKVEKSLTEFHKDRSKQDGHRTTCKPCKYASDANYRKENKAAISAWKKEN